MSADAGGRPRGPGGRPTKWRPEYVDMARRFCLLANATDPELAAFLEVNPATIYDWKNKYPAFSEAIKEGKAAADAKVAASLYEKATGQVSHPEEKVVVVDGEPVVVPTTRHYPPDTAAAFIWLKNRQPHLWRDRREVQVSGRVSYEILLPEDMDADIIDVQPVREALPEGDTHTDADGDGS